MAEGKSGPLWIAAAAGLLAVALGVWVLREGEPGAANAPPTPPAADAQARVQAPAPQSAASGEARIPSQGRIILSGSTLPEDAPFSLLLELPEEARSGAPAAARVISAEGRRLDLTASPDPEAGLRLEVDPAFLEVGRYMIEVETEEHHPLQIRRWVLEID